MTVRTYGPAHRWFAWRPVDTTDRGRVWMRVVWRRRAYIDLGTAPGSMQYWTYSKHEPGVRR